MAAEELGIPVDKVRAVLAGLAGSQALGWNRITAGSRTTFSNSMVIIDSARKAIDDLCAALSRLAWTRDAKSTPSPSLLVQLDD
jgi:hypothetical protein